jgi:predicted GNAT family acetyltransferase
MAHSISRRVDHSLRTLAGYEGKGLATACTYATIREGIRRGLEPIWWTEVENHGSRAVAAKIGLRLVAEPLFFERV